MSTDSYEESAGLSESGRVRKRPSVRRPGNPDDSYATSGTSSASETILFPRVRRHPSLPDLRTLRSSGDNPSRTAPTPEQPRASRSQARRFNRRQKAEKTKSKIQFLEDRLRQLKEESAYYLEDRDHHKDIIMKEVVPRLVGDIPHSSRSYKDTSDIKSI